MARKIDNGAGGDRGAGPIAAPTVKEKSRVRARCMSRGIALFLGTFALMNVIAGLVRQTGGAELWWIDFSGIEKLIGQWGRSVELALEALGAVLLVAWAVRPATRWWRCIATTLLAVCFALVALGGAVSYWQRLATGDISALVPVPASFVLGIALAFVAARVWTSHGKFERSFGSHGIVGALIVTAACVALFPLLQVATFGTTDYGGSAKGDSDGAVCAIVPGARLADDGSLSPLLKARVDSGIALVKNAGSGSQLVVSGGTEASGSNEADAMAEYARGQLESDGAPGVAVAEDQKGTSLEAMVKNTLSMAGDADRVYVTSSFYQLPRIKMLYLAAGEDVRTVPAQVNADFAASGTPEAIAREVGAWWQAWLVSYL